MSEQTNPSGGVEQATPSAEERVIALLNRQEQAEPSEAPEQAETTQEPQQVQADATELTPEDIPDEEPAPQTSTVDEFEIVYDGQQKKLSREEAIRLAQQGFDYTQKTQKLAEAQRAVEARLQAAQQAVQIAPLVAQDLATVKAFEAQLQQYQNVDWVRLASDDPLEYPKHRAQYDRLVQGYQSAVGAFQQKATALSQAQQQARAQTLMSEHQKMLERIPEWRDQAKYQQGATELRSYLLGEGVPAETVDSLGDALAVSIARKAMLYDRLVKSKADKVKQLRTAPPVTKPGSVQTSGAAQADADAKLRARLRKTGDLKDAAALLANRMK